MEVLLLQIFTRKATQLGGQLRQTPVMYLIISANSGQPFVIFLHDVTV